MVKRHLLDDLSKDLPPHFLAAPPLSDDESEYLQKLAHQSFQSFLQSTLDVHPIEVPGWKSKGCHEGVDIFQGPRYTSASNIRPYRFITSMEGTLEEVEAVLSNVSDDQIQNALEHYLEGILDMTILHHVSSPSALDESSTSERSDASDAPNEHILVRWFATQCPRPLHNRDFCVLEMNRKWTLPSGKRVWAASQHSIRLPTCPDLKPSLKFVRASVFNSGVLYIESDEPGRLEMHMRLELDFKGPTPQWFFKMMMKRRAASFGRVGSYIEKYRVLQQLSASSGRDRTAVKMIPLKKRKHCQLCTQKFNPLRWKVNCSCCGEVFCYKCTEHQRVPGRPRDMEQVCFACARPQELQTGTPVVLGSPIWSSPTRHSTCVYRPAAAADVLCATLSVGWEEADEASVEPESYIQGASDMSEDSWYDNDLNDSTGFQRRDENDDVDLADFQLNLQFRPSSERRV
ncbi:hypothetical protein SDRG_14517 [Saprolegnia diclina VS20]|uniref:FYVE-type domain-containing protein n=1 Tax=Saprolegnia diclina (strain VS20) TaxID=1156394 RepID=T0R6H8_SAPDV|nr:hypothetical protein SDRG_14517 [Saprolegnia diclina VS20]EQC27678.1 hypothetical protein SDRG_14517 [Saprolegnia diclina VS20]|eukprot:XP_008618873.1 hypothetical protein SDRG_14517 [Saprolegnia diclina VS20]